MGAPLAAQPRIPRPFLENDQVLINEPHGQPHDHKLDRVMVYLQAGSEVLHFLDGHDEPLKWEAGEVRWSPASGMHVSQAITKIEPTVTNSVMLVDIGVKKAGEPGKVVSTALGALQVDPKDCKLEFENSKVRVVRVRIGPRQSVPMHEHVVNHVVVYFTDQNVRETSPEGKAEAVQHKAGDFIWRGPCKHKLENLTDKPLDAVVVELKTPPGH